VKLLRGLSIYYVVRTTLLAQLYDAYEAYPYAVYAVATP